MRIKKTTFCIGGVTFSLSPLPERKGLLRYYLRAVQTHRRPPMMEIQIKESPPPPFPLKGTFFRKRVDGNLVYEDETTRGVAFSKNASLRALLLQKDLSRGTVYLNDTSVRNAGWEIPLFKLIVSHFLLPERGLLVHAAGIVDRGKGFLCVGQEGAGKSTLSRIFHRAGGVVLSDEHTIVRKSKNLFWIFGTPWPSTFSLFSLKRAPLRAILFLRHGSQNELRRAEGKEACRRFLNQLFLPPWDSQRLPVVTSLPFQLLSAVPSYLLSFVPTQDIVPFLRKVLREEASREKT